MQKHLLKSVVRYRGNCAEELQMFDKGRERFD